MVLPLHKNRIGSSCIAFSVLVHLAFLFPVWKYGRYDFGNAVLPLQAVMVDLAQATPPAVPVTKPKLPEVAKPMPVRLKARRNVVAAEPTTPPLPPQIGNNAIEPARPAEPATPLVPETVTKKEKEAPKASASPLPKKGTIPLVHPPLRQAGEFLATAKEHLTYQISMFNLPVGSAELEAKNEQGEVRISLKVKSAPAVSGIYPVDDLVETRHIGGNFILTRIRQQEGNFRSDRAFTLMLRDKKVFWIDRLTNRSLNETVPNSDVTDIISGLYYLRNRPLELGRTETLHVYDSDTYADLPIEVLRRERITLPGFRKADTIVIKPVLKTDGIFKRTGEVTIWLTDDAHKVPVKVETQISLGKVTVELIAADTDTDSAPRESVSAKAETE
ncbi:protein of unknown function, DUF3108-containing [Citrifermentans bemidjiense Bem]|uniref:DUF3108 domain-containing protein n=1 Tax=Citrifermentans bemidjiense (strain ATCC BAA-1014 / DSM 16622 / JCM 12645 / Bem) TaxID=404380 RepID=B5EB81_CITBB|nr:DUF3108 domain-containing protein [Citrifermentans bemidjiense]ACH40373.1 protein of unknown function, DUF3108-containing [Citrifermentans bemidjiense Bem]